MDRAELAKDWDLKAADWDLQVGDQGDANRRFNSDPVLWRLLGDIKDQIVLDAGCGTGYLSRQMALRGAQVTGIDVSPEMVKIAANKCKTEAEQTIRFAVDDLSQLETLADESVDAIVSNFVLMDLPDLDGAASAMHRVLRPGGRAVVIFCHPCFPLDLCERGESDVCFRWPFAYFEQGQIESPPWNHFKSSFTYFHRPLSQYWQAFRQAGLSIEAFDEPVVSPETAAAHHFSPAQLQRYRSSPGSVAFLLKKPEPQFKN